MIPQKDIQQDCLEFYDNVVQAYMEEYPGSELASIFMGDLITSYTCANCWHFTATVTKETAIQIKVINASTHVSFENLFWNTMSGSSDYRERKCPECNNGNIFNEIIFNGEAHVIKVFQLLRACDTNLKPNWHKSKNSIWSWPKTFFTFFCKCQWFYLYFVCSNSYFRTLYLPSIYKKLRKAMRR